MYKFTILSVAAVTLIVGCARSQPKAPLTRAEVVGLAARAATDAGYKLTNFNEPEAHFEYVQKDGLWSVFYVMKPPTPPGGHFTVSVDGKTGEAEVVPGE